MISYELWSRLATGNTLEHTAKMETERWKKKYAEARELLEKWVGWRQEEVKCDGTLGRWGPSPFNQTRAFLDGEGEKEVTRD
jgi:hypothetical protein